VEATGLCIDPTCEPDCAGKECGPDGCGGVCGECPEGGICTSDYLCEGGSVDATDGANSSDDGGDGAGTTAGTAGTVECPPGTVPKYNGLCVEDETANVGGNAGTEGEQSSGCAAVGVQPGPNRNITWLMFMAGLLLLSVRRQRN
jgi:MYXO-CTERM domain-containing protein